MEKRGNFYFLSAIAGVASMALLSLPSMAYGQNDGEWLIGFGDETEQPANDTTPPEPVKLAQLLPDYRQSGAAPQSFQQQGLKQTSSDNNAIFVSAIAVKGANTLSRDNFASVLETNIGQELREEDLRRVTQQIADVAREKGLLFATARVPEQSLQQGILQIELDEGRIDDVRIVGSRNRALARLLKPLAGQVAIRSELEKRVVLANDIPQITVIKTRMLKENNHNILEVTVREDKARFNASADNYGTRSLGPARVRLAVDYAGIITDSDQGGIAVRTNPIEPNELLFANGYYSVGIGNGGTRIGVAASAGTTEGGDFGAGNVEGDSRYVEVFAIHPLHRSNDSSVWINSSVAYLDITREDALGLFSEDTQVTFSAGLSSNNKLLGGRLRMGATVTQGLALLDTTRFGDPLASRFDGDGVFTKGFFYANWQGNIVGPVGAYFGINGQIANRALLASQEFAIGGAYSVRGFDFAELSGENGFSGLAEFNYTMRNPTKWLQRLQPYIFLDGGFVDNLASGFGDGTLLSGGVGIRADIGKFNLEVESTVPLNRDRFQSGNQKPHINVNLGVSL